MCICVYTYTYTWARAYPRVEHERKCRYVGCCYTEYRGANNLGFFWLRHLCLLKYKKMFWFFVI